jgi:hypothetical protein
VHHFADIDWQHVLLDQELNEYQVTQPEIFIGSTTETTITETGTKRFLAPNPLENFAKFEGNVRGNVRVKAYTNNDNLYAYLDRVKITLAALDEDKNERPLATYTFDASWKGSKLNEGYDHKAFDYTLDFAFTDFFLGARSFAFFFPIDADKTDQERLIADVTLYGHVDEDVSNPVAFFALYCEPGKGDLLLDLPML